MAKSYAGDLSDSGETVELRLRDQPGSGGAGQGRVIAAFAFGRLVSGVSDTGEGGISWDYTNTANADWYNITFDTPRPNTNYTIVVNSESSDANNLSITNKSTTGFDIISDEIDPTASPVVYPGPISVLVYDEDPVQDVVAAGGTILQSYINGYQPTASQTMSHAVWQDIDGSDAAFTPGSSISNLVYNYSFPGESVFGAYDLVLRLLVNGVEQIGSFEYNYIAGGGSMKHNYKHVLPSWGLNEKTIKLQGKVRESYQSSLLHPQMDSDNTPDTGILYRQTQLEINEFTAN